MTFVPQYWDGSQTVDTIDVSMAVKGQMMPDKRRMFAVITPHGLGFDPDVSGTLGAHNGGGRTTDLDGRGAYVTFVKRRRAQSVNDHKTWELGEIAPTLNQFDVGDVRTTVAIPSSVGVRRLTPRECERLMGWPDDWTRYDADGNEIADTHRYRFCGNGVVSNVAEWIGRRLP